ncbi:MAG: type II toxin-antitoxin system VapC family toxin [Coriobacteriia bacterium]|nr:type II toxin-antitoxin system VapC family toxin [Coriobacteriia bacterium]
MPRPTSNVLVLDTNIISETLKAQPDKNVLAWLLQNQEYLYLTAVTVGELLVGAYRLPDGKRRESLLLALERIVGGYKSRILAYDSAAAQAYALMQDEAHRCGRTLTVEDGMIAAICATANATLATRNTKDFAHLTHLNLRLVNPFDEPAPDVVEVRW